MNHVVEDLTEIHHSTGRCLQPRIQSPRNLPSSGVRTTSLITAPASQTESTDHDCLPRTMMRVR
jgi:hypothetical protein